MKRTLILLIMLLQITFAQTQGGAAGSFLRVGVGAREMGMAGALIASTNPGAMSFYYNPAQISMLKNKIVGFGYHFMPLDRVISQAGFSLPIKPSGGFAFNWIHAGFKDVRMYNSYGEDDGEMKNGDELFATSFSIAIKKKLHVGFSFKFIWKHMGSEKDGFKYEANGKAFDLGVLYKISSKISCATVLKSIGGSILSNTNNIYDRGMEIKEELPLYWVAGVNYKTPIKNLSVELDVLTSNYGEKDVKFGAEYEYNGVFLRTGLDDTRLHAGAGFVKKIGSEKGFIIDYAIVPGYFGEGISHLFSWQFIF